METNEANGFLAILSGNARENLVNFIVNTKQKTLADGKFHNFSLPPDDSNSPRSGITYVSMDSDNDDELKKRLLTLSQLRKYKSKGDIWIGLGSVKNSTNMIDLVVYNNQTWEYNEELEKISKSLLDGIGRGKLIRLSKKVSRNDKCPCNSGLKYKNCHGK